MKKLILFFAAVCYTAMMQAETIENVPYIDENGVEQICPIATLVNNSDNTWTEGWYVVKNGFDARVDARRSIVCKGAVHLILWDGSDCFLKVYGDDWHAGIEVSGEGNSLTIYGQKEQTGRLIAQGGEYGAGIGGSGQDGVGNNITINGGRVEAYGGVSACGIGGALSGQGINITINGGTVLAQGHTSIDAIGSHFYGKPASNIFVADKVKVMVNQNINIFNTLDSKDRNLLEHSSIDYDIANDIAGNEYFASIDFTPFFADIDKRIVGEQEEVFLRFVESIKQRMVESPLILTFDEADAARKLAKAKISAAKELLQYLPEDENIRQEEYIDYIFNTIGSIEQDYQNSLNVDGMVNNKKTEGIGQLKGFTAGYNTGKAEGKSDAFGTLGTPQNGPALIVTDKDDNEIILYSPKSVEYIKVNEK